MRENDTQIMMLAILVNGQMQVYFAPDVPPELRAYLQTIVSDLVPPIIVLRYK